MTLYLCQFIPGRVEHVRILKEAIIYLQMKGDERTKWEPAGQRGKPIKVAIGIKWGQEQATSFEALKTSVIDNVVYGGDDAHQYHLMMDTSKNALGGVLFQLPGLPPGTTFTTSMRSKMKIVMSISKRCLPAETRYSTTEREALAILQCLEEVLWLVLGSLFSTKVYTDHQALL